MVHLTTFLPSALLTGFALAAPTNPEDTHLAVVSPVKYGQPIQFGEVRYRGNGCPEGSIQVGGLDFEAGLFNLIFTKLYGSIQTNDVEVKVKCHLEVDFETTASQQLVVLGGTYHGLLDMSDGVYVKQQTQYKFENNPDQVQESVYEWNKAYKGRVDKEDQLKLNLTSPCSEGGKFTLVINNYLSFENKEHGHAAISVNELDAGILQSTKVSVKSCPSPPGPPAPPPTIPPAAPPATHGN